MANKRLRGLSLFSNVGIAEAYFEQIGLDILIANELKEKRAKFYSDVYPNSEMLVGDITDEELRNQIVKKSIDSEIELIIATPPCQGMSVAGNRNEFDERNQLIYYAVDVIKRVKVFLNTDFLGSYHLDRVKQISELEKNNSFN